MSQDTTVGHSYHADFIKINMTELIIIGAGISGLTIARDLIKSGYRVTVIEARDRIGGRIHSFRDKFSRIVEAGAEFVHGDLPLTNKLIEEAGQKKTLIRGRFYSISNNELEKGDILDDHWKKLFIELNRLEHDVTLAHFLQEHFGSREYNDLRERVWQYAEGFDIADVNRVSALALREEWSKNDDAHQYRIDGGYNTLTRFLRDEILKTGGQLVLSEPVVNIAWQEGQVEVKTASGKLWKGDKAIITVPLGILQKAAISFKPALPEHQQAFESMGFGGVIKFQVEFQKAFWESHRHRGLKDIAFIFSDADVPTWWSQLPDKTPLLTGWLSGPRTVDISHTPEVLYQKAVASLQYIFSCSPGEIESQIVHWHISDWTQDPFTFGAYSYPTLQSDKAIKFITLPVKNTLYFAGEAVYSGSAMGTVEAALTSAKKVITFIDPH